VIDVSQPTEFVENMDDNDGDLTFYSSYVDAIIDDYNAAVDDIVKKDAIIEMHEWIGERIYQQIPTWTDMFTLYPPLVVKPEFSKDLMQGLVKKNNEIETLKFEKGLLAKETNQLENFLEFIYTKGIIRQLADENKELRVKLAEKTKYEYSGHKVDGKSVYFKID
jgi:hypothetical protein